MLERWEQHMGTMVVTCPPTAGCGTTAGKRVLRMGGKGAAAQRRVAAPGKNEDTRAFNRIIE